VLSIRKIKVILIIFFIVVSSGCSYLVLAKDSTSNSDSTNLPSFNHPTTYFPSNRYTQKDDLRVVTNVLDINEDIYKYLTSTSYGDVYLNQEDLSFRIRNKITGYIWGSTINVDGQRLSTTWKGKVRSAVNITYFTEKNVITEESLFTDTKTKIEITPINKGFSANITFGKSEIALTLIVTFDNEGINVEIPASSIVEKQNKLATIKVYSFFGAVKGNEIPGYMFIPDGIGALIRYDAIPLQAPIDYYKEIYDKNLAYSNENDLSNYSSDGSRIYLPVFGFVHGVKQNAIMGVIENGAEYGAINVYQAGGTTDFYTIFPEFIYRKTFRQPINAAGDTIALLQNYINNFDIKIKYYVLNNDDATYVGMAKTYQNYLINQQVLMAKSSNEDNIPLRVDVLFNEKKKGAFFDEKVNMTTFKQYRQILDELKEQNITNVKSVFKGYTDVGYSYSSPYYESIDASLGSLKEFDSLDNIYFYADFVKATSKVKNYSSYNDIAKKINDQIYQYNRYNYSYYLLKPKVTTNIYNTTVKSLSSKGVTNLALDTIGNLLYSTHNNGVVNRKETVEIYQEMLSGKEHQYAFYDSNDYMFKYMDSYFNFPLYSSQYLSFDDTVPFIAIVLSNYVDLYSSYANFYPSAKDELLRLIDFGVYPSFIITKQSSNKLSETSLNNIYSSKWDDLKDAVYCYYDYVNEALKTMINASIIDREVLEEGVIKVSYDNNHFIVVNYTNSNYQLSSSIEVSAKDFYVG
jgi:hypothetical protein